MYIYSREFFKKKKIGVNILVFFIEFEKRVEMLYKYKGLGMMNVFIVRRGKYGESLWMVVFFISDSFCFL